VTRHPGPAVCAVVSDFEEQVGVPEGRCQASPQITRRSPAVRHPGQDQGTYWAQPPALPGCQASRATQDMTDFAGSAPVSGHFSQRQQDHD
jgi:hypothetical protein